MKRQILILVFTCLFIQFYGRDVTKEEALSHALPYLYMNKEIFGCKDVNIYDDDLIVDSISFSGKNFLFCFKRKHGGWVIISSETALAPVLAYSLKGTFPDVKEMPYGMKWLLSSYEDYISFAKDSRRENYNHSEWGKITNNRDEDVILSELGDVAWGQNGNNTTPYASIDKSYNKFCPSDSTCTNTLVGCGAVAMAQVMWYYKWPYSAEIHDNYSSGNYSSNRHISEYNWDNMPTNIYNTTSTKEIDAIASFLTDCGFACHMRYGCLSSSTSLDSLKKALTNIFHYSQITMSYKFLTPNWSNKIKEEIDNERPVIYRGVGTGNGGHFFIIYGYKGNHYHINWGWRGDNNHDMFRLDSLYVNETNYNDGHVALFGISPNFPNCGSYNLTNNDISGSNFEVYKGGPITIQNKTINSNQSGVIYSGSSIHITPPFHITSGANVHIAIRDMNCDLSRNDMLAIRHSPKKEVKEDFAIVTYHNSRFALSPNPATNVLNVESTEELSSITIYNLHAKPVLQTTDTEINVSSLPAGMYIVRAVTTTGEQLQSKFIKQ